MKRTEKPENSLRTVKLWNYGIMERVRPTSRREIVTETQRHTDILKDSKQPVHGKWILRKSGIVDEKKLRMRRDSNSADSKSAKNNVRDAVLYVDRPHNRISTEIIVGLFLFLLYIRGS